MRALAAAAVLASLASVAAASAAQPPTPLAPPTGFRDYCDGVGSNRICPAGGVPPAFWRPLHLPAVGAGQACPVTRARTLKGLGRVYGAGPVTITHVSPWQVEFPPPENSLAAGSGWAADKTPLVMGKGFHGAFAVRGRRLDAPGAVGFSGPGSRRPFEAVQFAAGRAGLEAAGYRGWAVGVWLTSPGCYGVQIDGADFSRAIVFRVDTASAARTAAMAATGGTTFTFGRSGGNIVGLSVTINGDGTLTARGAVQLAHPGMTVPAGARAALLRLAVAQGFFKLPEFVGCRGTPPDVASQFISITRPSGTKKVMVHGGCNAGFARLYTALSTAAGVR